MLPNPRVSIGVPVYNGAATIAETLRTILAQTYTDFELVVVDNASTDSTCRIVEEFSDPRLRLQVNRETVSMERNVETAIAACRAEYIAIYHADDLYEPDIVAAQVAYLDAHPGALAVLTNARFIDARGTIVRSEMLPQWFRQPEAADRVYGLLDLLRPMLREYNFLCTPTAMVRAPVYRAPLRRWSDPSFKTAADLGVWLGLAEMGGIGILPQHLIRMRRTATQYSARVRRLNTDRADFFLALYHYLDRSDIHESLTEQDRRNLRLIEFKDDVIRATNLLILGRSSEALTLLNPLNRNVLGDMARELWPPRPSRFWKWWGAAVVSACLAHTTPAHWLGRRLDRFWYAAGRL